MHNDHHDGGHHWKRGQRVDERYRGSRYVVNDYRGHHLNRPPHGYHWVHDDNNNYLLVAVASGVIASVILGAGR
jgi:Ni/Co efflux regulator RcnB